MANFHFPVKIVSRGKGQSVVAKAAYIARENLTNEQTGENHDYTRAEGLVFEGIFTPKVAPEWARDREKLWSEVERVENRVNSQLARSIDIALPHELTAEQRQHLLTDFVRENFVRKGMVADVVIHAPDREGDERNHHAHVLLTMRGIGPDGFGDKLRELNGKEHLKKWRENWARTANRYLERNGHEARIDHRSLEAQGIDREPTVHLGPMASQMERAGEPSERGDINREIEARNKERERLKAERGEVSHALRETGRDNAREVWQKEQEKRQNDNLSKLQGEIRLSYALSSSGEAFASALEDKGLILVKATAEDVARHKAEHVEGAPERAPVMEGSYYVVSGYGHAYALNVRTTGESKDEIEKRLAPLGHDTLLSVGDARDVMREVKAERTKEGEIRQEQWDARNKAAALLAGFGSPGMESQQQAAMRRIKKAHARFEPHALHPDEAKRQAEVMHQQREDERREAAKETTSPVKERAQQPKESEQRQSEERKEQSQQSQNSFAGRKDAGQQKREDRTARTEQTDAKRGKTQSLAEKLYGRSFQPSKVERDDFERERER